MATADLMSTQIHSNPQKNLAIATFPPVNLNEGIVGLAVHGGDAEIRITRLVP